MYTWIYYALYKYGTLLDEVLLLHDDSLKDQYRIPTSLTYCNQGFIETVALVCIGSRISSFSWVDFTQTPGPPPFGFPLWMLA